MIVRNIPQDKTCAHLSGYLMVQTDLLIMCLKNEIFNK